MPQQRSEATKSQLDKFKEAARKLECDDDEQRLKGQASGPRKNKGLKG